MDAGSSRLEEEHAGDVEAPELVATEPSGSPSDSLVDTRSEPLEESSGDGEWKIELSRSDSTNKGLQGCSADDDDNSHPLDVPIIDASIPQRASSTVCAELVDEEAENRRIEAAEVRGRDTVLAEAVEAHCEPIQTNPGKSRLCHSFFRNRSPCFYFMMGACTVIVVLLLASLIPTVIIRDEDGQNFLGELSDTSEGDTTDSGPGSSQCTIVSSDPPLSCTEAVWLCDNSTSSVSVQFSREDQLIPLFESCLPGAEPVAVRWFQTVGGKMAATELQVCFEDAQLQFVGAGLRLQVMRDGCDKAQEDTCSEAIIRLSGTNCFIFSWDSEPGELYHLGLVAMENVPFDEEISFEVNEAAAAVNLSPDTAFRVEAEEQLLVDFSDSSFGNRQPPTYLGCSESMKNVPTRWFSFVGSGLSESIVVCSPGEYEVSISTATFHQTAGSQGTCERLTSFSYVESSCYTYHWNSEPDVEYLLSVGLSVGGPRENHGFTMILHRGDKCDYSLPITDLPFTDQADTQLAKVQPLPTSFRCRAVEQVGLTRGVWYSWRATQTGCITASLSLPIEMVDVRPSGLAVYEGICNRGGTLQCVMDRPGVQHDSSMVAFNGQAGLVYSILVYEKVSRNGDYKLLVEDSPLPCPQT